MQETLVRKAKKGDKESFSDLILQTKNQAYKIAYCYLHNEEDSMDAVCNAVEKAYKSIRNLKEPKYFKTWFIRIVINECKKELKHREKIKEIKMSMNNNITVLNHYFQFAHISSLIHEIPYLERTMIYMKYYMGYTLKEISEIMDFPVGTVKTKIYSNVSKLRSMLLKEEGEISEC